MERTELEALKVLWRHGWIQLGDVTISDIDVPEDTDKRPYIGKYELVLVKGKEEPYTNATLYALKGMAKYAEATHIE